MRTKLFISYSHADSEHLKRLLIHLRPLERDGKLEVWADTKITAGERWRPALDLALSEAAIAILLVSADFIASDFIAAHELPPLLVREAGKGLRILPVIVKPCAFSEIAELSQFQAVNDPKRPLIACDECEREEVWLSVFKDIRTVLSADQLITSSSAPADITSASLEDFFFDPLFGEEMQHPERILDYYVYQYEHIDDLSFMPNAEQHIKEHYSEKMAEALPKVREVLTRGGWEGDGLIQILWLPPFLGAGIEDTYGIIVWFVKQGNNGTAFMASPVALPFARLLSQN